MFTLVHAEAGPGVAVLGEEAPLLGLALLRDDLPRTQSTKHPEAVGVRMEIKRMVMKRG